jgi:hypothetical protein
VAARAADAGGGELTQFRVGDVGFDGHDPARLRPEVADCIYRAGVIENVRIGLNHDGALEPELALDAPVGRQPAPSAVEPATPD